MTELVSWTRLPLEAHKHFSGAVRYRTAFDLPANWPRDTHTSNLNLGRLSTMRPSASNGLDVGISWTQPFSLDVSRALRPGGNELEIEIVNTWHNRLVGDAKLPAALRQPEPMSWPPLASLEGLGAARLGPLRPGKSLDNTLWRPRAAKCLPDR